MVDYTTSKTASGGSIAFIAIGALVVLVMLYALFAGGEVSTTAEPVAISEEAAPLTDESAVPVPATQ